MNLDDARQTVGDLLEAASELDMIRALVSDRSEPGTYAKVTALVTKLEQACRDIAFLQATLREQIETTKG
jgi:hypothetical protein